MQLKRFFLRTASTLVDFAVALLLVISGAYSAFALWDNQRVYSAAGDVQADMIRLKPELTASTGNKGADFSELLKVNPDVCGWLTLDNTEIDCPILQGQTNFTYINTDVYGEFALAGSIFLDSRNSREWTDPFSLIYGHHMADHRMFGDLDLYKDADFFENNRSGVLILQNCTYQLDIFSCMLVAASEGRVFEPTRWRDDNMELLLRFIGENALHLRNELLERQSRGDDPPKILCLSTCSSEFTDARTIVLAVMEPYSSEKLGGQ